jgi:hypothetical protein
VQRSLPEMNELVTNKKMPYRFYAVHRGGANPKATEIMNGPDHAGKPWKLNFVWSTPEFERQFGGIRGLPTYYLLDRNGRARAVLKGHPKDTLETLKWLVTAIEQRG